MTEQLIDEKALISSITKKDGAGHHKDSSAVRYDYQDALALRMSGSPARKSPPRPLWVETHADDVKWQQKVGNSVRPPPALPRKDPALFNAHVLVDAETLATLQQESRSVKPLVDKFESWTTTHVEKQEPNRREE